MELIFCLGKIVNKYVNKKIIRSWQVLRGELKQAVERCPCVWGVPAKARSEGLCTTRGRKPPGRRAHALDELAEFRERKEGWSSWGLVAMLVA